MGDWKDDVRENILSLIRTRPYIIDFSVWFDPEVTGDSKMSLYQFAVELKDALDKISDAVEICGVEIDESIGVVIVKGKPKRRKEV